MLAGCTSAPSKPEAVAHMIQPQRVTEHRGHDDLLTAGLGLDGLRAMAAPAFADPAHPTAAELRRRAIWGNWRGIADLSPTGGYGQAYGSVASLPGRENARVHPLQQPFSNATTWLMWRKGRVGANLNAWIELQQARPASVSALQQGISA